MKKRICSLLIIFVLLAVLPSVTKAAELPDANRDDCTIDVVLWDRKKDKGIVGAELVCYRVGYVGHDGDYNYHFYDILTSKQIPDKDVYSESAAAEFAYNAGKGLYKNEKYTEKFEKEGTYYFKDLKAGLYVVIQTKAAKGYSDMSPFLVSIPYLEDGEYIYKVTANVKTELKQEVKPTTPSNNPNRPTYGTKLPQTGQLTWPIPWLASSGMALFALGWWLCFGRRKDSYEN